LRHCHHNGAVDDGIVTTIQLLGSSFSGIDQLAMPLLFGRKISLKIFQLELRSRNRCRDIKLPTHPPPLATPVALPAFPPYLLCLYAVPLS
jgi:hypothetical protein